MPGRKSEPVGENLKKRMPPHALHIFREAYQHAKEQYSNPNKRRDKKESDEAVARKVAWSAVKKEYKKDEKSGKWKSK